MIARARACALALGLALVALAPAPPRAASAAAAGDDHFGKLIEGSSRDAAEAGRFLRELEREGSASCFRANAARWAFSTNATDANRRRKLEQEALHAKFQRLSRRRAAAFARHALPDPAARRQLALLMLDGRLALPDAHYAELQQLLTEMKEVYAHAEICPYATRQQLYCTLAMDPDVARALAASRDWDEQLHLWRAWRDAVGPPLRQRFLRHLELANDAARLNGFADAGEQARAAYEVPGDALPDALAETWAALSPLYRQLHAYVRRRLLEHYGPQRLRADGPLPAHVFGNMWAQNWRHLYPLVQPYPRRHTMDVTGEMLRQGFTPLRMFQEAESFFTSLGLPAMPPEFWQHSMLERPLDREVSCAASAWDFCNHKDYRIKQCTAVTQEDLLALHHEMAHVQYYMAYADQPVVFRTGANPGFHEALGDAMALFAGNPKHLQRIGLLANVTDDHESQINYLMGLALEKVAYLPFAYIVDIWRWGVQAGRWGAHDMNARWWELRLRHQGVVPPVARAEHDFDPGAKYHVAADMPYVRYFVGLVLQFQFLEALCLAAGHYGPLHECDIYRSREAGRLLQEVLQAGASRPWQEAVRTLTRGRAAGLDARPMLDFFRPLGDWLAHENRDERLVGWTASEQDHALFAPLHSGSFANTSSLAILLLAVSLSCLPGLFRTLSSSWKTTKKVLQMPTRWQQISKPHDTCSCAQVQIAGSA